MRMKTFSFADHKLTKGQKRMLKLARMVETIHPTQFNMDDTLCKLGRGCGSEGCVLGWAAANKLFPELTIDRNNTVFLNKVSVDFGSDPRMKDFLSLRYADDIGTLFGGSDNEHDTPLQKAAQIREYVQNQILNS